MEKYLRHLPLVLKELLNEPTKNVTVVMGNESCDMDSAVCALTLAHHINQSRHAVTMPLLNIPKEDVPLRTEVIYSLGEDIVQNIPTRDDFDFHKFPNMHLILVDHHVLQKRDLFLQPKISQIIDHRQISEAAKFPPGLVPRIELVGSCATLVADQLFKEGYRVMLIFLRLQKQEIILFFLKYCRIVLDCYFFVTPSSMIQLIYRLMLKKLLL